MMKTDHNVEVDGKTYYFADIDDANIMRQLQDLKRRNEENDQKGKAAYTDHKRPLTLPGAMRAISETIRIGHGSYSLPFILAENCARFGGCYRIAVEIWCERFPEDFFTFNAKVFPRKTRQGF